MIKYKGIEMVGCEHDFKNYLCTVGYKGNVFMTIGNILNYIDYINLIK